MGGLRYIRLRLRAMKYSLLVEAYATLSFRRPSSALSRLRSNIRRQLDAIEQEEYRKECEHMVVNIAIMYDDYTRQLEEGVVAHAETVAMADHSFQQWFDCQFPDAPSGLRTEVIERYRSGTL